MMRFRHLVALVAAGTLVGGAATVRDAAASDVVNASHTAGVGKVHNLTTGSGSLLATVVPLTGSPNYLVYSQRALQTAQLVNPLAPTQRPSLQVRSKAGKFTNLGPFPSPAPTGWSMSGDTVTATRGSVVFVYSASTGAHHTVTLVTGTRYLSAAPGGFLYAGAGASLFRHNASGTDTSLGDPIPGIGIAHATSSALGAVLIGAGPLTYLKFSDPAHPVTLNPSGADGLGGATSCDVVTATAAACINDGAPSVSYVPLNGSQATDDAALDDDVGAVALAGDVLLFTDPLGGDSRIYSFKAGSSAAETSTGTYQNPYHSALVSAYGKAIAMSPLVRTIGAYQPPAAVVALKSATQVSKAFPNPRSPITAAAFSLTNGRIAYTADPAVAASSEALVTVLSRRLTTHAGSVPVSAPSVVAGQSGIGIGTSRLVAASAFATVYAHGTSCCGSGSSPPYAAGLKVVSRHHSAFINMHEDLNSVYGVVALSGNRLLYSPNSSAYTVYNVRTGHRRRVRTGSTVAGVALSGHYLAYATKHGAIFRKNLQNHKTVELAKPSASYFGAVAVYESGDWVGWEDGTSGSASWLRNAATMAKPIQLAHPLYSLTSAGALLDTTNTAEFSQGPIGVSRTTMWLRSYSGHTRTLLSARAFDAGPQISGGVLAWINTAGLLKVVRFIR